VHVGADSLTYAIREIVDVAHKMRDLGLDIIWENIGDPIQKGEKIEPWIKEILHNLIEDDNSWGYCATAGVPETREFLANEVNKRGGVQITADDIMFFNGIGDAVSKIYGLLRREARILGPTPAYSTHSSAESSHSGYEHLTYELDPYNNWMPDIEDIRLKVKYNDSITGILLINPDNPTGAVYNREVLQQVVEIAREYKLFIICDEIYAHIVYNGYEPLHLSEVAGDVCAIVMRGISKEIPWPGARCGWIEVLNRDKDPLFNKYVNSILAAKRLEVCSTTAPQMAIPLIMGDEKYPPHLKMRAEMFEKRAKETTEIFSGIPGVMVNCPNGAFYMTILFEEGLLNNSQTLEIENPQVKELVQMLAETCSNDYRFVYYLMGATGICVVPLSGFCCKRDGFRITILDNDDENRRKTFTTLADAIKKYLSI
jgi:aspartate/methionine/tyrosine aminotransferase